MKCQDCEKNPATFHLTDISEEGKTSVDLCEECAAKKGLLQGAALPGMLKELLERPAAESAKTRCPDCGISFEEFKGRGRLGCPRDYEVFRAELEVLLQKVHGAAKHVGRFPRGAEPDHAKEERLRRLRRDLSRAVREEQYEEAARLRDEIRLQEEALRGPR